jgi:hypothetical protein
VLREIFSNKKLVTYIGINIFVSALTALIVISLWTRATLNSDAPVLPDGSGNTTLSNQLSISTVVGAGDLENERFSLAHVGTQDVSLSGWRLRGEDGSEFRFPALVLHPGAQVVVYSKAGDDSATELFWDRQIPAWYTGEEISLVDASGQIQARYTVP